MLLLLAVAFLVAGCAGKPAPSPPPTIRDAERFERQAADLQAQGNWTAAAAAWERAAQQFQLLNNLPRLAVAWHNLAICLRVMGEFEQAHALLEQAADLNARLGETNALWRNQITLVQIENTIAPERAAERLQLLETLGDGPGDPRLEAVLQQERARSALAAGDVSRSLEWASLARSAFAALGDIHGEAAAGVTEARALEAMGLLREAEARWRRSLELYESMGDLRGITVSLAGLGQCLLSIGEDPELAQEMISRAEENMRLLGAR